MRSEVNKDQVINESNQTINEEWGNLTTCKLIRIALAGAAGNFLEWFDFSLFGYYHSVINFLYIAMFRVK